MPTIYLLLFCVTLNAEVFKKFCFCIKCRTCYTTLLETCFLNLSPSRLQLNADCLDDLPLDYDLALGGVGGAGGVGALALEAVVSGASSDGTLSEGGSSVVLDPGVRRVGLPQDYQDPDTLRDSPVTATTDTHTGNTLYECKSLLFGDQISGVILTPSGVSAT